MEIEFQKQENDSKIQLKSSSIRNFNPFQTSQSIKINGNFNKLPNGYSNQKFFDRYVRAEYINSTSWTINVIMILLWFQYDIQSNQNKDYLLYISTVFHILSTFILFICYKAQNDFKLIANKHDQIKKVSTIILQIIILAIRPYHFLDRIQITFQSNLKTQNLIPQDIQQIHKLNHILCIISLVQIFLILPVFFINSKYQNPRGNRICNMYGAKATTIYSIKSMFKQNRTLGMYIFFVLWMLLCAVAFRISEFRYTEKLKSFQNSLWLIFISIVSVGYGDLYPRTQLGKVIAFISMYTGVFITSVIVIIINNLFIMNNRQKRSLIILNQLQRKSQLKIIASQFLKQALWRTWKNKRNKFSTSRAQPSLKQRKLKKLFHTLRNKRSQVYTKSQIKDQFQNNFKRIFGYLDNIQQNQERIINFMQETNIKIS